MKTWSFVWYNQGYNNVKYIQNIENQAKIQVHLLKAGFCFNKVFFLTEFDFIEFIHISSYVVIPFLKWPMATNNVSNWCKKNFANNSHIYCVASSKQVTANLSDGKERNFAFQLIQSWGCKNFFHWECILQISLIVVKDSFAFVGRQRTHRQRR